MSDGAELIALRAQVTELLDRVGSLQAYADARGAEVIASVSGGVYDAYSAKATAESYDSAYFASVPFSRQTKIDLAKALIRALAPYPFVDTTDIVAVLGE